MREERLRAALRDAPIPDRREAEERAWRVIQAAYAEQAHLRPRPLARRRVLQLAIVVGLLALLISPAGAAVRDWVGDAIETGHKPSHPALTSLPAPGSLLVDSVSGPWVVHADGSKRLLGDYAESTWSPRGLYIAATTPHELTALDPEGDVRWSLARAGPIRDPRWSPDGFRIAYRSGHSLRIVVADGSGDRLLEPRVVPVAPAWRPGPRRVLAFAAPDGSVRAVQTDSGREVFRTSPGLSPTGLAWSPDGSQLTVVSASGLRVLDANGKPALQRPAPRDMAIRAVAASPTNQALAVVATAADGAPRSQLLLNGPGGDRQLFAGPGRFSDVAFSPDGRWLLLAWPSADQWLFLRVDRPQRIVAISRIASQFAPGRAEQAPFPQIAGWCCQRFTAAP
jgi:hypothetical protein